MTNLQESFVDQLPQITAMAHGAFRQLDAEAQDEAVQNTIALCWKAFSRLEAKGELTDTSILKSIVWYSVKQTKSGRTICGVAKAKDAMDQRGHRTEFERVELRDFESKQTSIPDHVSFRIDFPRFLAKLGERQRNIAVSLMQGESTSAVARQHGVTPAAISQFRVSFKRNLEAFFAV